MSVRRIVGRPVSWLVVALVAATVVAIPSGPATAADEPATTGVISGKIAFADDPWDGTPWRIEALPTDAASGTLATTNVSSFGSFRLVVAPGTYRLRAVPVGERTGIPPMWLGGTLREDEAKVVTVAAGQMVTGAEIRRFTGADVPRRATAEWRPFIKGTPRVGWTLTVDPQSWLVEDDWFGQELPVSDAEGQGDLFTFQWFAGRTAIPGATERTFTPAHRQLGQRLSVQVGLDFPNLTVTNGTTESTGPVLLGRNRPCKALSLSGAARAGARLRPSTTCWQAPGTTLRTTWFVNGHRLKAAPVLGVARRYRGDRITAIVTARAKGYETSRVRTNTVRIR